jgi:hypothetical protein
VPEGECPDGQQETEAVQKTEPAEQAKRATPAISKSKRSRRLPSFLRRVDHFLSQGL